MKLDSIPILRVYNKIDRLTQEQIENIIESGSVLVSAKTNAGFDELLLEMERQLFLKPITLSTKEMLQ